jgi:indole-3-glycerol phosphate synthase
VRGVWVIGSVIQGICAVSDLLERIVATKREEVVADQMRLPLPQLRRLAEQAVPARRFFDALAAKPGIALIAEVKRASPSKGVIRHDFDPVQLAMRYVQGGASALSVLTDKPYFQGDLAYLSSIRQHVSVPLLRKDFIVDPYQVYQARAAGADAVLLIAECLTSQQLKELVACIAGLGMEALVELYEPENLAAVLESGCRLVGINNRDLRTFEVDLDHTLRLLPSIPSDRLVVAESGIGNREDVLRLEAAGVGAMLVGESLMRQADVGRAAALLLGHSLTSLDD